MGRDQGEGNLGEEGERGESVTVFESHNVGNNISKKSKKLKKSKHGSKQTFLKKTLKYTNKLVHGKPN